MYIFTLPVLDSKFVCLMNCHMNMPLEETRIHKLLWQTAVIMQTHRSVAKTIVNLSGQLWLKMQSCYSGSILAMIYLF